MCYWFPRAQQRLTLLTFESGPEIAGYSFLLLLLYFYERWPYPGSFTPIFSTNIRIHWERIHWGSPSIPLLNCAIDFPGHNRLYSLHSSPSLPIPHPPILGLRSFAAQSPHTNEIAGWALKPKCVVIPVRIQSGDIHAIKRTYLAHTRN